MSLAFRKDEYLWISDELQSVRHIAGINSDTTDPSYVHALALDKNSP
jgi:hypothetical protein